MPVFDGRIPKVQIEVVSPEGQIRGSAKAIVAGDSILTDDVSLHVLGGDEIRRPLPNGSDEVFLVLDAAFSDGHGPIPPHYQIKVRRQGALPHHAGGHFINVTGTNARVTFGNDSSMNVSQAGDVFKQVQEAVTNGVLDDHVRNEILHAIANLKEADNQSSRLAAYQGLMSTAADHMTVLAPFLGTLGAWIVGGQSIG